GARPVLGRFAPCALPMPPDPVGQLERSRARPSHTRGPVQCSGASRPARFRCPRTPSASSSALALGLLTPGGPAAARARGASDARAAPPRAPDPVGWLGASRRQPRLLAQDDVEREAEAFQGAAQAVVMDVPPQR